MEKDFNPTESNAVDLERAIIDLKSKKAKYVQKKIDKQLKITKLKDKLKNPNLDSGSYVEAKQKRVALRKDLNILEHKINEVNLMISGKRKLQVVIDSHLRAKNNEGTEKIIRKINELKEKYQTFSGDHTRISSMRTMAAQITLELESISNII